MASQNRSPNRNNDPRAEYEYMLAVLGSEAEVWKVLQHQFSVLQQRIQTIFTLGALGITVTGFSGHRIVAAGPKSGIPLVIGLCIILTALLIALYGASKLRWISSFHDENVEHNFHAIIQLRNRKTRLFKISLTILLAGLGWYVLAISNFLLLASYKMINIY